MKKTKIDLETKIKKGDIISDENGEVPRKVILVLDDVVFFDYIELKDFQISSVENLVDWGYQINTPEWSASNLHDGDEYWYIDSTGSIECDVYGDNDKSDILRERLGLIVENEEAGRARSRRLWRSRYERND